MSARLRERLKAAEGLSSERRRGLQRCADGFGEALATFYEALSSFEQRRDHPQVLLPIAAGALNSAIFWMARAETYKTGE